MAICPVLEGESPHPNNTISQNLREIDIQKMARQLRAVAVQEASYFKERDEARARLGLPKDFGQQPPRAKLALLADTGSDTAVLESFLRLGRW